MLSTEDLESIAKGIEKEGNSPYVLSIGAQFYLEKLELIRNYISNSKYMGTLKHAVSYDDKDSFWGHPKMMTIVADYVKENITKEEALEQIHATMKQVGNFFVAKGYNAREYRRTNEHEMKEMMNKRRAAFNDLYQNRSKINSTIFRFLENLNHPCAMKSHRARKELVRSLRNVTILIGSSIDYE